mmetsp:Transcript_54357/g.116066  ORF Transcript_54357/g.116066 Transcript_54357/m.116066 type:complete len:384 (+) Transcript_54357:79-1230(+)|eukprot:CAMPEP_0206460346 /NCGR_PEP_ID=MMETSP0324_2-20121206/24703_1 /ASSEMBLY_ACC=CAM_ASM_000836 /TAXON_ID=2866 /ORGANISM="Crypthecodinium cohnii, Strain Seligo" /LENGTH=383 /DNA_ID=CAMNT_0053932043 /DNA_START=74 /DNA_END=1225 /DNA_ORIENTATION=-
MKLYYHTGWSDCAIHYCPHNDSGAWTTQSLQPVPGAPGWKVADLSNAPEGATFVMCNGAKTEWDNPPPSVGGQNYETPKQSGDYTLRNGRLERIKSGPPVLVVSDLDHTMVGHDKDPDNNLLKEFKDQWLGRYTFGGSYLVYSTGRNKIDAMSVALELGLLRPQLLICAVGTEVYQVPQDLPLEGAWAEPSNADRITLEPHWTQKMVESFDRDKVEETLKTVFVKFDVKGNSQTDPYRIPTVYKVDDEYPEILNTVRAHFGPGVEVISSGGDEYKYVDFCSSQGGKMKGCQFAIDHLNMPPERTLVCGDSGNDESMYRAPGVRGVAVGNSLPELIAHLGEQSILGPEAVTKGAIFDTKAGSKVFYANEPVAGAICEALARFWP